MKTHVKGTIVELLGDEMARILWDWIKERLLAPFLDLLRRCVSKRRSEKTISEKSDVL